MPSLIPIQATRPGDILMNAAQPLMQGIQALPGAIAQDEQIAKAKAAFQSEQQLKDEVFVGLQQVLQDNGIDPSTVQLPDPKNPAIDSDTFLQQAQKAVVPYVMDEQGQISPQRLESFQRSLQKLGVTGAESEDAFQRRDLLVQNDPLSQINLNEGGRGEGAPLASTREDRLRQESQQVRDEVSNMGVLGAMGGGASATSNVDPIAAGDGLSFESNQVGEQQPVKILEQEKSQIDQVFDPLISETLQGIRTGRYSAEKGASQISKLKAEKVKAQQSAVKAQQTKAEELQLKMFESLSDAMQKGYQIIDKTTGRPSNPSPIELYKNPNNYSVGAKLPTRHIQHSTGGGGGRGSGANSLLDQRNKARDDLKAAQDQYNGILNDISTGRIEEEKAKPILRQLEGRIEQLNRESGFESRVPQTSPEGVSYMTEKVGQYAQMNPGASKVFESNPLELSAENRKKAADLIQLMAADSKLYINRDALVNQLSSGATFEEIFSAIHRRIQEQKG